MISFVYFFVCCLFEQTECKNGTVQALLTITEFLHAVSCLSQIIFEKVLTKLSEQTECKNGTA